jgi:hypothetical protein
MHFCSRLPTHRKQSVQTFFPRVEPQESGLPYILKSCTRARGGTAAAKIAFNAEAQVTDCIISICTYSKSFAAVSFLRARERNWHLLNWFHDLLLAGKQCHVFVISPHHSSRSENLWSIATRQRIPPCSMCSTKQILRSQKTSNLNNHGNVT